MIHRTAAIILFCFIYGSLWTQGASVRVEVLSGGHVSFIFNSIAKYKAGITTPADYTTIGITVDEGGGAPDYRRWELFVEAEDADADGFLTGTNPANQLLFSTIELSSATVGAGCASCQHIFPGPAPANLILTTAPQVLVDGNAGGLGDDIPPILAYTTDWIGITYYAGTNPGNNLMGEPADMYSDVILLTIMMYDF